MTTPETAQLLDHLVDRYVVPVLQRRIAQGALQNKHKMTQEQELNSILDFATGQNQKHISQTTSSRSISQAPIAKITSKKERDNLERLLQFGSSSKRRN